MIASYKVYGAIVPIANDLSSYPAYNVTTSSIEIKKLQNDTIYYFVVTAFANGKESATSDEVSGTPFAPLLFTDTGITWGGHYDSGNSTGTDVAPQVLWQVPSRIAIKVGMPKQ